MIWALLFSALNAVFDPIFIFPVGLGAAGAAAGTALSQAIALVGLLRVLHKKTGVAVSPGALLAPSNLRTLGPALASYGKAGVLVLLRTWGKVAAYTYCSRQAAQLGAVASAAHLLCFNLGVVLSQRAPPRDDMNMCRRKAPTHPQFWMTLSLLASRLHPVCESVAVATQTLLARAMGTLRACTAANRRGEASFDEDEVANAARRDAWHVIRLGSLVGGTIASLLTAITALKPSAVIAGLTTDTAVRAACGTIIAPVLACQLFKGLAFPANGVIMGGLDWSFSSAGIWLGSLLCIALVHARSPPTLVTIWVGLAAFMGSQTLFSVARVLSRAGPWRMLFSRPDRGGANDA